MTHCRNVLVGMAAICLCACSWLPKGDGPAVNITETGVSPTSSRSAVWLAAVRPGLSAVGKDYLFVGPMTVNREGARRSYLWFAAGTTIDRHITGADKPQLESVVMVADGTPMTFDLVRWSNDKASAPYPLSIDSYVSYAARVTASQVRQLANAGTLEAYVTDINGRSPVYSVVEGEARDWLSNGADYSAASRD